VEPKHEAIAASLQVVFEEAVFHLLNGLYKKTKLVNLCLAGGCAMNSVANGKIRANTPFKNVYVQPAAADNGTALGAAYHVWNQELQKPRGFVMGHSLWGPEFSQEALGLSLESLGDSRFKIQDSKKEETELRRDREGALSGKAEGGSYSPQIAQRTQQRESKEPEDTAPVVAEGGQLSLAFGGEDDSPQRTQRGKPQPKYKMQVGARLG